MYHSPKLGVVYFSCVIIYHLTVIGHQAVVQHDGLNRLYLVIDTSDLDAHYWELLCDNIPKQYNFKLRITIN